MGQQGIAGDLRRAAEVIRERGWRQGASDGDGRLCLMRAMEMSRTVYSWGDMVWFVGRAIDVDYGIGLVVWNDAPGRTVDEVLDALERAAQLAEAS